MDVLLVAAKKEKIADYTNVIAQSGRTPVLVDVDAFALQNAFEVNYGLEVRPRRGAAQRRRQCHQHQHPAG
jgi:Tfp pilus assembly PilM family ATPase